MNIVIDDILYRNAKPKIKLVRNERDDVVLIEVTFENKSLLITDKAKVILINGEDPGAESLESLFDSLSRDTVTEFVYRTYIF